MNIAFFDSGAGGLTVLHEAIQKMPYENFIYYGDTRNAPYGTKATEEIRELVMAAVEFLASKNLKALVLACNTATSVAVKQLREKYPFPIIGMEPAVRLAVKGNDHKKILVSATEATLREEKLSNLVTRLSAEDQVAYLSLQGLVTFAENFDFDSPQVKIYLLQQFAGFNWNEVHSLVLGCTHFIYFKKILREIIPPYVQILDGNEGTVNQLMRSIEIDRNENPALRFYLSGEAIDEAYFQRYLNYLDEQAGLK